MQTFKLLSNDSVLLSQPVLIKQFGRAGAHFISQLHYWLTKNGSIHNGARWIYNSAKDWAQQISISERQMERIIAKLITIGVVQSKKLGKNKFDRTNYYTIDYDALTYFTHDKLPLKTAENSIPPLCRHRVRQKDGMYIQKLPNKDFNKSEQMQNFTEVAEESTTDSKSQVKLVNDLNLKNQEKLQTTLVQMSQESEVVDKVDESASKTIPPVAKTSIAQDMLKIWNEHFVNKAKAKLTKDLAPLLVAAFKSKFNSDLKSWEEYCQQIQSSPYLMGDAFKLTITWALKFFTIERIRAGELGIKSFGKIGERSAALGQTHSEQQVEQMIETLDEPESVKALRHKIMRAIGHNAYYSWFHQASFCEGEGGIRLEAPNQFVAQYWETHFEWVVKK